MQFESAVVGDRLDEAVLNKYFININRMGTYAFMDEFTGLSGDAHVICKRLFDIALPLRLSSLRSIPFPFVKHSYNPSGKILVGCGDEIASRGTSALTKTVSYYLPSIVRSD